MNEAKLIWMDGEFIPWEEAKVHVLTHTLHYGTVYLREQELIKRKRDLQFSDCKITQKDY